MNVIGIMSGTSLDGMDAVLIQIDNRYRFKRLGFKHAAYPRSWAPTIRNISRKNLLRESALFGAAWAEAAAKLVRSLQQKVSHVDLIGVHGQTVAHLPQVKPFLGYPLSSTIQLGDLSRLAIRSGVPVVGNFRLADIAVGGQGAPLVPHAHRLLFGKKGAKIAVQNFGGIGNVTLINDKKVTLAFDTGPGNVWIDTVIRWKTNGKLTYDKHGQQASQGKIDQKLQVALLRHPFLHQRPPKSADSDDFGEPYLRHFLSRIKKLPLSNALATVTSATAKATAQAYQRFLLPKGKLDRVVVAGGGAKNRYLLELLSEMLGLPIEPCDRFGIPASELEAISFALLAFETIRYKPSNEPKATGAKYPVICGLIAHPLEK